MHGSCSGQGCFFPPAKDSRRLDMALGMSPTPVDVQLTDRTDFQLMVGLHLFTVSGSMGAVGGQPPVCLIFEGNRVQPFVTSTPRALNTALLLGCVGCDTGNFFFIA